VALRARWVALRARWVALRARWVALRARWVTQRARWVTQPIGTNDRFAMGTAAAMRRVLSRFTLAEAYSVGHPVHAESFLTDVLKRYKVRVRLLPRQRPPVAAGEVERQAAHRSHPLVRHLAQSR
jgi:hypothetical protein